MLLFSAAGQGFRKEGRAIATPSEITQKLMWYPTMPDPSKLAGELAEAGVLLDDQSVAFFLKLCAGHRGIFMAAMRWVETEQKKQTGRWDFVKRGTAVRESLRMGWRGSFLSALKESRAIPVNRKFNDLVCIPTDFADILTSGATADISPDLRRELTIHGFLQPERCAPLP